MIKIKIFNPVAGKNRIAFTGFLYLHNMLRDYSIMSKISQRLEQKQKFNPRQILEASLMQLNIWNLEKRISEEIENNPTLDIADNQNLNILKLQVEIEIGMSEFLEVGFYNTFKEYPLLDNNGGFISRKFEYDEYKLRLKYKVFK